MTGAIPPSSWPATKRAICLEYPDTPEWTALITGVLLNLSFGYYWDKDYANWEDARDAGKQILQSWFEQIRCDAGAIPVLEPQCVDYPNNSPMLDWQPANPFLEPGRIPPGYVAQPWGVVGEFPILTYETGDVISGLFGLPVLTPALGQGLARVRIKFTGTGTVEVHLIKVALGGIALLTWDDNPLTISFVDTSMDFLALPPESSDVDIQEITFDTPGEHHIDVTMLPRFSAELGFAGYGGGIRKVVLCGPDAQAGPIPNSDNVGDIFDMTQMCDLVRFVDGKLQIFCCGAWTEVPGQAPQGVGGSPQPGAGSPQPTPGGGCQTYHSIMGASNSWLIPATVSTGDTIEVINATGATNDAGDIKWKCPDGNLFFAGACTDDTSVDALDPLPAVKHMKLIAYVGSTPYDVYAGTFTVPAGHDTEQVVFQVNDDDLAGNSGTLSFDVRICNNTATEWSHIINLRAGPNGFVQVDGGQWVAGSGLVATHVPSSPNSGKELIMKVDYGQAVNFSAIKFTFDAVIGTHGGTIYTQLGWLNNVGAYTALDNIQPAVTGNGQILDYVAPLTAYGLQLICVLDVIAYPGMTDGSMQVYTFEASGSGYDPFV